ncbi:MAG: hypothetical protein FD164_2386 [Nitrospirae bacterium]|nr:MAG: hypothetical protein FD164_2386 [Nitrospirota bacterium]
MPVSAKTKLKRQALEKLRSEVIEAFKKKNESHTGATDAAFTAALEGFREAERIYRLGHPGSAFPYTLTAELYSMLGWKRQARQVLNAAKKCC